MNKWRFGLLLFLVPSALAAQTSKADPVDRQGWYEVNISSPLNKKWKLESGYQIRFYNEMKSYHGSYFSLGAERKLTKKITLLGQYRLAIVKKGVYNRLTVGGLFKKERADLEWDARLLAQNQLQDFNDPDEPTQDEFYTRLRFRVKLPVTKFMDFVLATEPIVKWGGRHWLDNWRNQAGLRFALTPSLKTELYYLYRPDFAKSYTRTFHTFGVELDYQLKRRKKII